MSPGRNPIRVSVLGRDGLEHRLINIAVGGSAQHTDAEGTVLAIAGYGREICWKQDQLSAAASVSQWRARVIGVLSHEVFGGSYWNRKWMLLVNL